MNIGNKIKDLMLSQNITQKELANRLNVQVATISRYLSNQREPNAKSLANIATALNTTTDYILGKDIKDKQNITILYGIHKFNFRVAILIEYEDKVLLETAGDFWNMIVGRVHFGDSTIDAAKREL